jgi:hypothetical protein
LGDKIGNSVGPVDNWQRRRGNVARFIGYGKLDYRRVLNVKENKITLLASDQILSEEMHKYSIPIPSPMRSMPG